MASTLVKVAIGLAGVTTVGGGATFVYLNSGDNKSADQEKESKSNTELQKEEPQANTLISALFDKASIKALTDDDNEGWTAKWKTFKAKYNTLQEKEAWKFERWEGNGPEDDLGIKGLKQKCTNNIGKKVVDENSKLFVNFKDFCTKPKTEQPENK